MLPQPYDELHRQAAAFIPAERLITDALRLLTYGTDASFYRLVPKLVVVVEDESEVTRLLEHCRRLRIPVTFRAAGTSLSGQSVTDSVLHSARRWLARACRSGPARRPSVCNRGSSAALRTASSRPSVARSGPIRRRSTRPRSVASPPTTPAACAAARRRTAITPLRACGSCSPTAGSWTPTIRRAVQRSRLRTPHCWAGSTAWRARSRADPTLAERIRHKFRMKNTTGYSLNALVDFDDPLDILTHLMIGSEGTLGFISEITYHTVPEHAHKASALILFDDLETACKAVTRLKTAPVAAVELMDRAALTSVEQTSRACPATSPPLGADGAALLVETRAATAAELARQVAESRGRAGGHPDLQPARFLHRCRPSATATGRSARACSLRSARCVRPAPP